MPEKLVIAAINLLVYYLIVKMSYIKQLLIIKLIFINIKFNISKKVSCTYNSVAKPRKKTKSSYQILKRLKN